jgi:hypothetical protein
MNYNLNIQSEDLPFIIEAIKLRTLALINSLESQVKSFHEAKDALEKAGTTPAQAVQEAVQGLVFPDEFEVKRKAPYGYKKNGEPRKRMGRPPNIPF